ncbi:MAG: prolyl oligopeptidase family serine peptidase [Gammaproteobacteria bacterium]|nr:prolyl oligopeptidase family serine peptidase [Gammaproteobacteria bacterium]
MTYINKAPYGTWISPIESSLITADSVSLDELQLHSSGTYWLERRPDEQGRCVIVKHYNQNYCDLIPKPYSARSRVHEYGGGVYCIADNGIYFVNDNDQNIYFCPTDCVPVAITQTSNCCYADLQFDEHRQRLICIQQQTDDNEDINSLISIDLTTGTINILHSGHDFYASPRLSPCGTKLSWLCWNHPDMPWDKSQLWLADNDDDYQLNNIRTIQHPDSNDVSFFQPQWSPDNQLFFVSDLSGWWNLYCYQHGSIQTISHEQLDFGLPQWVFAQSIYAFTSNNTILCAPIDNGIASLALIDTVSGALKTLPTDWNSFSSIQALGDHYSFIAASPKSFPEVISMQSGHSQSLRQSCQTQLDTGYYSYGQTIQFRTRHNDDAFAIYYAPANKDFAAAIDEKPPLVVLCHGGPTAMADPSLDMRKQYWTSRGFALLDVNYSGSTGFGRTYRERLNGNWGLRDAEDCCDAAQHLVDLGLADSERLIIKGGSAGGYTVLCALTFHDTFSAGASYYGIGELESLLADTHKFESRYLDHLVGPYPERKDVYQQRSPINYVELLNCPVIFFQGTEDKVVPKEQAEKMFAALKDKGIPVAYVPFEGEQHGFRKAETIQRALDSEYAFYAKIFDIPVESSIQLHIENLDDR